jgi:hypothetical protein
MIVLRESSPRLAAKVLAFALSLIIATLWSVAFVSGVLDFVRGKGMFIHPNNGCVFVGTREVYAFAHWPSLACMLVWVLLVLRPATRTLSLPVAVLGVVLYPLDPYMWCDALYWFWRNT